VAGLIQVLEAKANVLHEYGSASGVNLENFHVLGYRFDDGVGFRPDAGESWIVRRLGDTVSTLFSKRGWMTALWQAPSGTIYVTDASSRVYVQAPESSGSSPPLEHTPLDGTLTGVWGLDEDHVFAWGRHGGQPVMYLGHHTSWRPISAPGFVIGAHGIRRDLVFAVGEGGFIARWDGSAWHNMPSPTPRTLSRVFVESDDEVYACGHGKDLLQGSVHGWVQILTHTSPLRGVVKWQGDVWVAAGGDEGLSHLKDGKLVSVKPNLKATHLESRHALLITCPDKVVQSVDGKKFTASFIATFEDLTRDKPPSWRK
jgi:hypothetical protein